jgi:hypothetical protein
MIITWHGEGAVKITEKDVTIAINPHDGKDTKMPSFAADILLLGNEDASPEAIRENPFVIDKPGEYEIKDIFVYGVEHQEMKTKKTIFILHVGGVSVGYLGGLNSEELSQDALEKIEGIDILLIPVGGNGRLSAKQAVKLANQIEPRIVVPIEFSEGKGRYESSAAFLKEYGAAKVTPEDKLKIVKKELPQEDTKVVLLSQS